MHSSEKIKAAQIAMSSLMFSIELTLTIIDEVEKTCVYRHGVKQALNNAKKILEPDLDGAYLKLLVQDENLVMGISDKLKELAQQIGHLDIGQICAVSESIPEILKKEINIKLKQLSA